MEKDYTIYVKQNYIYVTISRNYSLAIYKSIFENTISECLKNNKSIILFDARNSTGNPPVFDRYDLAVYFAKISKEHPNTFTVKVAFVGFPPLIDPGRFGETVAVNRGVNVKVMDDIEEAFRWLEINPDSL